VPSTELKQKILAASQHLFIEKGYKKVTYKEIANQVGISKSLLQYHFPQKSQLLEELMNDNFDSWIKTIPVSDLYTKLTVFLLMFFHFISCNSQVDKFMSEIIDNNELFNSFMTFFSEWLTNSEFVKQGNDKFKAALLFTLSGGLQLFRFKDKYQVSLDQVTHTIMTTLLKLVGKSAQTINKTLVNAEQNYEELKTRGWQLRY
jgi:AcrR family transcriptional regulator